MRGLALRTGSNISTMDIIESSSSEQMFLEDPVFVAKDYPRHYSFHGGFNKKLKKLALMVKVLPCFSASPLC